MAINKRFCICSLRSHLNVLTFFPLTGGCSEGLDAFRFFSKQQIPSRALSLRNLVLGHECGRIFPARV